LFLASLPCAAFRIEFILYFLEFWWRLWRPDVMWITKIYVT